MFLGEAVAEGIRRYLHDQDRTKERIAFLDGAEKDVEAWTQEHLDWFLSSSAKDGPYLSRHLRFALKRKAREAAAA